MANKRMAKKAAKKAEMKAAEAQKVTTKKVEPKTIEIKPLEKVEEVKVEEVKVEEMKVEVIPVLKYTNLVSSDIKDIKIMVPNTDIKPYKERKVKIEKKIIISEVPNVPVLKEWSIDCCEPVEKVEIPLIPDIRNAMDRIFRRQ